MSTHPANSSADRRRRWAYAALVAMTIGVAAGSLAIAAPAWWPGSPGRSTRQPHVALAQRTAEMKQQQLGRLSRYAWRDKPAGIVTIPIDQAMDLVVAQTATMKEPSAP